MLACLKSVFGALAGTCLGLAFAGRTKGNACASGLREADGNGLLRRSGSMFAAADCMDFFANKFARLSRGRLARALVLTGLFDCSLVRHHHSPIRPGWSDAFARRLDIDLVANNEKFLPVT